MIPVRIKALSVLMIVSILLSCTRREEVATSNAFEVDIMPLRMSAGIDTFFFSDLGIYTSSDSLWSEDIKIEVLDDEKFVIDGQGRSGYGALNFKLDDVTKTAVVLFSNARTFTVCYPSKSSAQVVSVKGEMTNWRSYDCVYNQKSNCYEFNFSITPGKYQYKFVVDGEEKLDPSNPTTVLSDLGGLNSLFVYEAPGKHEVPHLQTIRGSGDTVWIRSNTIQPENVMAVCDNQRVECVVRASEIGIVLPPRRLGNSSIRVWSSKSGHLSNDLLIPLKNGDVVTNAKSLSRTDFHGQVMYFTLVDRFNNGNPSNDEPINDERLLEITNFMGGDIQGITNKIKDGYFTELGINAIWLSPITQNPLEAYQEYPEPHRWYSGYHGYWPIKSNKVDHRFGDEAALHELVKTAHKAQINIYLDFICNHIHEKHKVYLDHPDWATDLYLEDSVVNIRIWEEQRLTTWFDDFLPSLDFSNQEVIEMQTDSAFYWLKEFDLDGYRHDATKHVPTSFWRNLTQRIRQEVIEEEGRPVYQIGETYGSRELIQGYLGSGLLDAQFDFPLYFELRNILLDEKSSFESFNTSLTQSLSSYGHHHLMGNMTGNHDQPRFISLAGGALSLDEDSRAAGFDRVVGVGEDLGYKRLQLLHAIMMAIPGVPVNYYGDEIGIPGAGDPDSRRMMKFGDLNTQESETFDRFKQLVKLRRSALPLIYGDTEIIHASSNCFALKRTYFGKAVVAVFNKSGNQQSVELDLGNDMEVNSVFNQGTVLQNENSIKIEIPAYGYEYLFTSNK